LEGIDLTTSIYNGIRETRPSTLTITAGYGDSESLSQDFRGGCLANSERTFEQGLQCQQINSIMALLSLDDSVFIIHAPQGCSGCVSMASDGYRVGQIHRGVKPVKNPRVILTNIDQNDIIMGGEKKIREAVNLALERYSPRMIFLFTSCASGIIGDDTDAILANIQPGVSPILVPIHCDGFKTELCASGFDAAFIAIKKYLLPKDPPTKKKGLVNLFAPTSVSYADQLEIEKMLAELGATANYVPFYSSLDKIRGIPAAEVSTAICKVFADEFMYELESAYGIPYSHTVMPIGVRNTDVWFLGIAKQLGKETEAREYIEKAHARVHPEIARIRRKLEGKTVFICGGTGRSFASCVLADDFGMRIIGLQTSVYDNDADFDIDYLNRIQGNFPVSVSTRQPYETINIINRLRPNFVISPPSWSSKLGIPTFNILDGKRPTMGYDGILYLGNKIAAQAENPGLTKKIARYAHLPYKKSWYETDPFKFVKKPAPEEADHVECH
jgi:nitrogenase molybdenum-iron protein alpha chain